MVPIGLPRVEGSAGRVGADVGGDAGDVGASAPSAAVAASTFACFGWRRTRSRRASRGLDPERAPTLLGAADAIWRAIRGAVPDLLTRSPASRAG